MNTRAGFVVALLAVQSCGVRECESERWPHSAEPETTIGARFADEYFTLVRTPLDACKAQAARARYINGFLGGFVDPDYKIFRDASDDEFPEIHAGMRAGQEYRRANPDSLAATYASFGFTPVSIEGLWYAGLELGGGFVPASRYPDELWELQLMSGLQSKLSPGSITMEGTGVRIKGYMSRRGYYGGTRIQNRMVYVEEVTFVSRAQ